MGIFTRAIRNIMRRKARTALIIVTLGLALAILVALPANISANQQASQKAIEDLNDVSEAYVSWLNSVACQIEVSRPIAFDYGSEANNYTMTTILYPLMNISDYVKLGSISNVTVSIPILRYDVKDPENANITLYDVYGIPLESDILDGYSSILPSNITSGRNLRVGDSGVVVLHEALADKWRVGVGGRVDLLGQRFEVVGIQRRGEYQGLIDYNVTAAFMSLKDAQRITNLSGQATKFVLFADEAYSVYSIRGRVVDLYSANVSVQIAEALLSQASSARANLEQQQLDIENMMVQLQSAAIMQIGLVVIAQGVIVFFIMLYTVRERTREIGTLKAMGASNGTVLGQFMLEGILLSLLAGIVGIIIGIIGTSTVGYVLLPNLVQTGVEQMTISITPKLALYGLGTAMFLGTVGSLYPAWRAAITKPSEAMKYD
ncbi:MAG: FtsX-like permease family protein [Candidatus Bathyarchaeota archaeon]|nr:FtsX-like permease family protein [Candidatus Termiticorpusculum sp.]